jgi:clan AA aspartic protease (TIGR02281 family)
MNRLAIGCLLLIFLTSLSSFKTLPEPPVKLEEKNVKWLTWEQAIQTLESDIRAGKKPRKIFVDVYTNWCGWCIKMDKETFEQPQIAAYLNEHFYPVKLNAEQKEDIVFAGKTFKFIESGRNGYHELAEALLDKKMSYPTVIFLNEKAELLQRIPGYLDVPTFDCIMHYLAEEHYTKTPWEQFQKDFKENKTNLKVNDESVYKKIVMKKTDGVFTLPCRVNNLVNLDFIFDTGASNVVISSAEAVFMYKHNYLKDSDFIGTTYIMVADGTISENSKVLLREIDIDGLKLQNVEAVIVENPNASLLLGQSALSKLGKITLDNESGILIIHKKS